MSKRNLILFIIFLLIALSAILGFLYLSKQNGQNNTTTGTNFFAQFNPFSNGNTNNSNTNPGSNNNNNTGTTTPPATTKISLRKVSSMPIAGFTIFSKERLKSLTTVAADNTVTTNTSTTTQKTTPKTTANLTEFAIALKYVAKNAGTIYETFADNILETQVGTTSIPQVYDAYFGNKGQNVAMRYLEADGKTIETFLTTLPKETFGSTPVQGTVLTGTLLPENIENINISSDTSNMFYLFNNGTDMVGTTMNFATGKKTQVFDSPFTEWTSSWPTANLITFTTKPASGIPGYTYSINPASNKNLNLVLNKINGLTILPSPDGKMLIYSDDSLNLNLYNMSTGTTSSLGVKTLPEKCVWNTGSTTIYCAVPKYLQSVSYPDSWYQGETSFSDDLWKIDVKTGNATLLVDPTTVSGGEDIDGIKLALDPGENYLFFVNKKDSYLWEFSLK